MKHPANSTVNAGTGSIQGYMNRELTSTILESGRDVEVVSPIELRNRIADNLKNPLHKFDTGEYL